MDEHATSLGGEKLLYHSHILIVGKNMRLLTKMVVCIQVLWDSHMKYGRHQKRSHRCHTGSGQYSQRAHTGNFALGMPKDIHTHILAKSLDK